MSSHYSVRNGQKYFYYKCTKVMHRNKEACPSKPLGSREFENAVIEKVKELSQDRSQLKATLENANLVAQKELEPLRKKKPPWAAAHQRIMKMGVVAPRIETCYPQIGCRGRYLVMLQSFPDKSILLKC
ncbi:hypothetical protein M1N21_02820 [Dehalococcoidia bacterium]|nr:hypothetical protein [Dehalococcoidia bacterium]